ncbi:hypothetical protein [Niabella sp.]|uniref:hypothetical protein n=1 Tax=Niabella sp. TaxID=1962976 RepID=UPI002605FCFB|nr:hypothetical protein [Niabella sp.]
MRKLLFLTFTLISSYCLMGQVSVIDYNYDNAGNRSSRQGGSSTSVGQWAYTGNIRCAVNANLINTGNIEKEERDNNPNSSTYNQTRWIISGYSAATCPLPPNWVNTGNYRCESDGNNGNTGYEEIEQRDDNPGSVTYNQLRWILGDYNKDACPLPCPNNNCASLGPEYRCINGDCEEGIRVCISSNYYPGIGYINVFHYEWSDGTISEEYEREECCPCN